MEPFRRLTICLDSRDLLNFLLRFCHQLMFKITHSNHLVYNCTWEDPRIDRELLNIDSSSSLVVITSAGCNILDYLLDQPASIHSVDINPRQNFLLQLKLALFLCSDHTTLFQIFGLGSHPDFKTVLNKLKPYLSRPCFEYWSRCSYMFSGKGLRPSFYWHGTTGFLAWMIWLGTRLLPVNVKSYAVALFGSRSLEMQSTIYEAGELYLWPLWLSFIVSSSFAMSLIGVPPPQVNLIQTHYPGGLLSYIKDKLRNVMTSLPLHDNYFWHVYSFGCYSEACCPSYLVSNHFNQLASLVDRITTYNSSVSDFLQNNPGQYTHFILLDHLDWLVHYAPSELEREWNLILSNSAPGAKILYRSAGRGADLIPKSILSSLAPCDADLNHFHHYDRVGTYESLHLWQVQSQ